ncbi:hypothetical protein ACFPRL_01290 [Pseudoclavibacter helvolus]
MWVPFWQSVLRLCTPGTTANASSVRRRRADVAQQELEGWGPRARDRGRAQSEPLPLAGHGPGGRRPAG